MKDFKTASNNYILTEGLRGQVKPGWQEMLKPAKDRVIPINPLSFSNQVYALETRLYPYKETLVGKNILEVGCNEGARSYLMAKYHDTYVTGIDVDDYTVDQSPDLNVWNPADIDLVHHKFDLMHEDWGRIFPESVSEKVIFQTSDIAKYRTNVLFDMIVSWDTLEHILDLPTAFKVMYDCMEPGGISYHEYNPFFAINGGHSLCTLDFFFGHCRLSPVDFERYIKYYRPEEEKIDLNFYHKCLNRATRADITKYATDAGFEILLFNGVPTFKDNLSQWKDKITKEYLPEVNRVYPTAKMEDLLCDTVVLILKK